MIRTNLLQPSEARKIADQRGMYTLVEYEKDLSCCHLSDGHCYSNQCPGHGPHDRVVHEHHGG